MEVLHDADKRAEYERGSPGPRTAASVSVLANAQAPARLHKVQSGFC